MKYTLKLISISSGVPLFERSKPSPQRDGGKWTEIFPEYLRAHTQHTVHTHTTQRTHTHKHTGDRRDEERGGISSLSYTVSINSNSSNLSRLDKAIGVSTTIIEKEIKSRPLEAVVYKKCAYFCVQNKLCDESTVLWLQLWTILSFNYLFSESYNYDKRK